jgi:hypothetical protein
MGKIYLRLSKSTQIIRVVLLGIIIFSSCKKSSNSKLGDDIYNIRYKEGLNIFNKEFVDHFPTMLNQNPLFFEYFTDTELDSYRIILIQKKKKQEVEVISDSVQRNAIAFYHATDSCNLVVNQYTNKNNWFEQNKAPKGYKKHLEKECYTEKYPIPNFWRNKFSTESNACRLPDDFKIYVLQAKQGADFDEKYLTRGVYMPKSWKHGYSKGVAISTKRNIVVYWFVIW